jgi:GTP-binding protein HflX
MNVLSSADVLAENKLFATLDTTVRVIELVSDDRATHKTVLLSDTVGFIRKLPAQLVASFRSTLAETIEADVLLHVVDISHPQFRDQIKAVQETLLAIGAHEKPVLMVFNKIDALEDLDLVHAVTSDFTPSVAVSAMRGINISSLREAMLEMNDERHEIVHLLVPYSGMNTVAHLYRIGTVLSREDRDDGVEIKVRVETSEVQRLQEWAIVEKPKRKALKKA